MRGGALVTAAVLAWINAVMPLVIIVFGILYVIRLLFR